MRKPLANHQERSGQHNPKPAGALELMVCIAAGRLKGFSDDDDCRFSIIFVNNVRMATV
jgi:hypothetical protein